MSKYSCIPPGGGKPRLCREQCSTCIYRPGNQADLRPGRLLEMTRMALSQDSEGVICHHTIDWSEGGALCRGFYDKFGYRNNFVRIMLRLGGFLEVEPPERESWREI